jgi:hypothetical protein
MTHWTGRPGCADIPVPDANTDIDLDLDLDVDAKRPDGKMRNVKSAEAWFGEDRRVKVQDHVQVQVQVEVQVQAG